MTAILELRVEPASSPAAGRLAGELDALILERYPGLPTNGLEPDFDAKGGVFVVGYAAGEPVACGALRREGEAAEIKRMYVAPACRGRGFARTILAFLEAEAGRRGFARAILETGIRQPEAIGLYRSAGWREIQCWGAYADEPVSRCFAKDLPLPTGDGPA